MSGLSLHEAIISYLEALEREGSPQGTVGQRRSLLRRFHARFPNRQVGGIATQDLAQFLYGPTGICTGRAPATTNTYRAALGSFFMHAELMGWTKKSVSVPKPAIRQRRNGPEPCPTRLTRGQLALLFEPAGDIHPVLRGMIAVACNTALRISDVSTTRVADLNLQTGELYTSPHKTGRADALPLTRDLDEELRRYLTWRASENPDGPYLFPGWVRIRSAGKGFTHVASFDSHVSYDWSATRLHQTFRECGVQVEKREAWHVIRRSVARIYFDDLRGEMSHDHALRQTAALLGHLQTATTEKYLGMQAEIQARNASLRGQRFIGGLPENIRRIHGVG